MRTRGNREGILPQALSLVEMPKARYKTCTGENCRKKRFKGSLCEEHWNAAHGKSAAAEAAPAAASA
jgi:hypothetical protein